MPTIWRCSWCDDEADLGSNIGWWEWVGTQAGGLELTYHQCAKCFAEKTIRSIITIEGMKEDKDEK